jgi:DNA-binding response OmpR family regulator
MGIKILGIDRDINRINTHAAIFAERNIGTDRVDTMSEGVVLLLSNKYLFIAINSDTVDFMPMLGSMRSMTNTPIMVMTGSFTTEKEVAALEHGADLYARWHETPEGNIASVMAHIGRTAKRGKEKKSPPRVIICGNMLIMADHKMVFCKDAEIAFTSKEYGVLLLMLENRNMTVSLEQFALNLWGRESATDESVRKVMDKLRKKLSDADFRGAEIANYKGMGYRLTN